MSPLASSTTVDLARAQFATTSIYHFLFVPLTLGLGPIVAVFRCSRSRSDARFRSKNRQEYRDQRNLTLLEHPSRTQPRQLGGNGT